MSIRSIALTVFVFCAIPTAPATPYWIAWEGDDWPENQGWARYYGNWDGPGQGPGAMRTLEGGLLEIDSRGDLGVYDFHAISRPGAVDPEPGEEFVMQWRVKIENMEGGPWDASAAVFSDDARVFGVTYGIDHVRFRFESNAIVSFAPHVFHSYEVRSRDMLAYEFFVDGVLARSSAFVPVVTPGWISWGNGTLGSGCLGTWDYYRCGVFPEPMTLETMMLVVLSAGRRRSVRHV